MTAKQMESYRNLMWEIKQRIEAIDIVLAGRLNPIRTRFAEEFCYLQLRLICEVIAIACLVAHGNLKPRPKLFETYKADFIMSELAKLHPTFFPTPLAEVVPDGPNRFNTIERKEGHLTKDELEKLWSRHAGSMVHRGSAKKVLAEKDYEIDLSKISEWRDKIVRLLATHTIVTPDKDWVLYVVMDDRETGNVASALLARRGPPTPPHGSGPFPLPSE